MFHYITLNIFFPDQPVQPAVKWVCQIQDLVCYRANKDGGSRVEFLSAPEEETHSLESPETITAMLLKAGCFVIAEADFDRSPAGPVETGQPVKHSLHNSEEPTGFLTPLFRFWKL